MTEKIERTLEDTLTETQLIDKARRMAKCHGMLMHKSRARMSIDNCGEFMLVDADRNIVVAGERYDWTAQDVIDYIDALDAPKPHTKILGR